MLIIFDLDDTLIDTSGCITPVMLELALRNMVSKGLHLPDFSKALTVLKNLNAMAESAEHALDEFLEIHALDPQFLSIGLETVYGEFPEDLPIFALEDAHELLFYLREYHKIALVTVGKTQQQLLKLKKAGIDSSIFSKIVVTQHRNKKDHYQMIMNDLEVDPCEVIVCGDRFSVDLSPAKELGCVTIHMKWGRGVHSKVEKEQVDYSITRLMEIKQILSNKNGFSKF